MTQSISSDCTPIYYYNIFPSVRESIVLLLFVFLPSSLSFFLFFIYFYMTICTVLYFLFQDSTVGLVEVELMLTPC